MEKKRTAAAARLSLSRAERDALDAHLADHAVPSTDTVAADAGASQSGAIGGAKLSAQALQAELRRLDAVPARQNMRAWRSRLPMSEHSDALHAAVDASAVSLVRGEPGCGKSTQTPQLLLERAAERGEPFNMVVAQPRRLAAVALAERVAAEVGDDAGAGGLVGYAVRGESQKGPRTVIQFVTTGVLLRMLERGAAALGGLTHLVLDEVQSVER